MESENLGIRHAALCKRRSSLFKKASELAILCDAEVAVIIISPDGKFSEFASSSIQEIVTKFKNCYKLWKSKKEVSKQIETRQNTEEEEEEEEEHNVLRNVVGKDLDLMSLDELDVLLEKVNKGLMSAKDRKTQLLNEELEQSRIQQEEALQRSQILMKQVGDLQALAPHDDIYCPMPLDVMEGDARTCSSSEYVSSSITLAPTNGPETQHNFQIADTTLILPSPATATAAASREYISNRASNTSAAASPVSAENRLSSTEKIYTPNLTLSLGVSGT